MTAHTYDDSARNSGSQTSNIQTSEVAGSPSQLLTDPNGNTTQDIYDAEGDVIRQIQTITSDGVITGYIVTGHGYLYDSMDLTSAVTTGFGDENNLLEQSDYVPFTITGSDPNGLRYSQQPTQVAKAVSFYNSTEAVSTADLGQIQSVSVLAASGGMQTTFYSDYVDGKPEMVVDPQGNTTQNSYDANGNLIEVEEHDAKNNLLSETTYTYTDGTSGVPAGLLVETDGLGDLSP